MNAISKNLHALKESRDTTQSAIAGVAGATPGAASKWFSGEKIPRSKYIEKIADYYDVTVDDLTSDQHGLYAQLYNLTEAPPGAFAPNHEPRKAYAPLLGRIHAGDAQEPDIIDNSIPLPYEVLENHPSGYFLEVEGGCMNMIYPEGCFVFVDPDKQPQNGSIAVVSIDDADYIMRRLYIGASNLMLVAQSFENGWDDIIISGDDHQVRMVGTVVWYQSKKELE